MLLKQPELHSPQVRLHHLGSLLLAYRTPECGTQVFLEPSKIELLQLDVLEIIQMKTRDALFHQRFDLSGSVKMYYCHRYPPPQLRLCGIFATLSSH